jgi:hypothetical protein
MQVIGERGRQLVGDGGGEAQANPASKQRYMLWRVAEQVVDGRRSKGRSCRWQKDPGEKDGMSGMKREKVERNG